MHITDLPQELFSCIFLAYEQEGNNIGKVAATCKLFQERVTEYRNEGGHSEPHYLQQRLCAYVMQGRAKRLEARRVTLELQKLTGWQRDQKTILNNLKLLETWDTYYNLELTLDLTLKENRFWKRIKAIPLITKINTFCKPLKISLAKRPKPAPDYVQFLTLFKTIETLMAEATALDEKVSAFEAQGIPNPFGHSMDVVQDDLINY